MSGRRSRTARTPTSSCDRIPSPRARGERALGKPAGDGGFSLHLSCPADRRSDRKTRSGRLGRAPVTRSKELLDETIEAHGGRERWRAAHTIEFALSSGGFAFLSRSQPNALRNLKVALRPHERRTLIRDFPRPGWQGAWTPDRVEIRDPGGGLAGARLEPRRHFRGLLNKVHWDKLDILYFAGYALWNYLTFPFLLEAPGVLVAEGGCGRRLAPPRRRLRPGLSDPFGKAEFSSRPVTPARPPRLHGRRDRGVRDRRELLPRQRRGRRASLLYPPQSLSAPRAWRGREVPDARLDRDRRRAGPMERRAGLSDPGSAQASLSSSAAWIPARLFREARTNTRAAKVCAPSQRL